VIAERVVRGGMASRVAITGLGLVTPIGNDVETFWSALLAGKSGVGFLRGFSTEKLRSDIGAQVESFDASPALDDKERDLHGRVTQMLVLSAHQAITHAKLGDADGARIGVLLGTGQGAVEIIEENVARVAQRGVRSVSPFFIPTAMPNAASALVSIKHGFQGPSFTVASACATGIHAIALGALMIVSGDADAMIVGGGEAAMFPNCVAGFGNARALARAYEGDPTRASRPYDIHRSGFVMGEGAGALVIESEAHAKARGANILAFVDGWGMASDAEHIARPHPEGRGITQVANAALRRAGLGPKDIQYLNPHATSTPQGDIAEYHGLRAALGASLSSIPVSATKSLIGHLLGGAGAVEAIATTLTVSRGAAHPTINLDEKDPVFELDLVTSRRAIAVRHALKISAGFGGHDAALVISSSASLLPFDRYAVHHRAAPGARVAHEMKRGRGAVGGEVGRILALLTGLAREAPGVVAVRAVEDEVLSFHLPRERGDSRAISRRVSAAVRTEREPHGMSGEWIGPWWVGACPLTDERARAACCRSRRRTRRAVRAGRGRGRRAGRSAGGVGPAAREKCDEARDEQERAHAATLDDRSRVLDSADTQAQVPAHAFAERREHRTRAPRAQRVDGRRARRDAHREGTDRRAVDRRAHLRRRRGGSRR
jgi:3-oxoacyl-[acyl-carrier-protein] synthase II